MDYKAKVEDCLIQMGRGFEEVASNVWVVSDELFELEDMVIMLNDPLVVFRFKLMELPKENKEQFYEKLLELNAFGLVHGAFAIEGNNIVIVDSLQVENLDFNEFQATMESIELAVIENYHSLKEYVK